tara:strand:+ start:353 stop:1243 length:891 start_codon:yes stop_codon:yes gene_type:complete
MLYQIQSSQPNLRKQKSTESLDYIDGFSITASRKKPNDTKRKASNGTSSSTSVTPNAAQAPISAIVPRQKGSSSGSPPPQSKKRTLANMQHYEQPHWKQSVQQQIGSIKQYGCINLSEHNENKINDILSNLKKNSDGNLWIPSKYSIVSFNHEDANLHKTFELITFGKYITIVPVIFIDDSPYTTEAICCTDIDNPNHNKYSYLITKPINSSQILTRKNQGFDCNEFKKSLKSCDSHNVNTVLTSIEKLSKYNEILKNIMNQLLETFDDPNQDEKDFTFTKAQIKKIDPSYSSTNQ